MQAIRLSIVVSMGIGTARQNIVLFGFVCTPLTVMHKFWLPQYHEN